jgi:hypothetical protein
VVIEWVVVEWVVVEWVVVEWVVVHLADLPDSLLTTLWRGVVQLFFYPLGFSLIRTFYRIHGYKVGAIKPKK